MAMHAKYMCIYSSSASAASVRAHAASILFAVSDATGAPVTTTCTVSHSCSVRTRHACELSVTLTFVLLHVSPGSHIAPIVHSQPNAPI
jgi:hypothetical protein